MTLIATLEQCLLGQHMSQHVTTCAGGKRKIIDTDAKATALRELEEETAGVTLEYVHAWLHAHFAYA